MASITMTPAFLGGSATLAASKQLPTTTRCSVLSVRASNESEKIVVNSKEVNNTKRDLIFGLATAAVCSIASIAMADEPKRGTEAAKKKYAQVCVTMPTARICRN